MEKKYSVESGKKKINTSSIKKEEIEEVEEVETEVVEEIPSKEKTSSKKIYDDEQLTKSFIGQKYDNFKNDKFNIYAFLFRGIYYCYRKMFLYGLGLILVNILIIIFVKKYKFIIQLILCILCGLFTNKIYLDYVNKKTTKLKNEFGDKHDAYIDEKCKINGGTSYPLMAIGIIIEGTIIVTFYLIVGITGLISIIFNMIKDLLGKLN